MLSRRPRHILFRLFTHLRVLSGRPTGVADYRRLGATIGINVRMNGTLDGVNPHLVSIGDHVQIAPNTALLTHCAIRGAGRVRIGNHVWIGFGALILPGVTVGDCCVVGAGSVVTRDVAPGSIAAGNPARVLRGLRPDERATLIEALEANRSLGADLARTAAG